MWLVSQCGTWKERKYALVNLTTPAIVSFIYFNETLLHCYFICNLAHTKYTTIWNNKWYLNLMSTRYKKTYINNFLQLESSLHNLQPFNWMASSFHFTVVWRTTNTIDINRVWSQKLLPSNNPIRFVCIIGRYIDPLLATGNHLPLMRGIHWMVNEQWLKR